MTPSVRRLPPSVSIVAWIAAVWLGSCGPASEEGSSGDAGSEPAGRAARGSDASSPASGSASGAGASSSLELPDDVFRLRTVAVLHAQRDTTEGYLAAASAFEKLRELRSEPEDLLDGARVHVLAESWETGVDQWSEAGEILDRYRAARPGTPVDELPTALFYLEGMVARHLGHNERAAERFRVVTNRRPDVAAAWFQLGSALASAREFAAAEEALEKVVELDPDHVAAHYKLFRAAIRQKKRDEADEWNRRFTELKETVGKVADREYEKCEFTRIRLEPPPRSPNEPPRVEWSFEELEIEEPLDGVRDLVFVDLDGDCAQELVIAGDRPLAVLDHGPDGGDGAAKPSLTPLPGVNEHRGLAGVVATELDNDDGVDLLLLDRADGRVSILRRAEDGSFEAGARLPETEVVDVTPIDFDHDGDVDIAVLARDGAAELWRNDGDGTYSPQEGLLPEAVGLSEGLGRIVVADLDLENDIDFVAGNAEGPVAIWLNLRSGPFRRATVAGLEGHSVVAAFDVDNDGDFDVVGAPRRGAPLRVARLEGVEGPSELAGFEVSAPEPQPTYGDARALEPADLDGDGDLDLLVASDRALIALENRSGGEFVEAVGVGVPFGRESGSWRAVEAGDLDGDGRIDIAAVTDDGLLRVWRNASSGAYRTVILALRGGRDNRAGIGAHVETWSGTRYQRVLNRAPDGLRVGLGTRELEEVEGVSILWPNGIGQALVGDELRPEGCGRVEIVQRVGLVASCPFLYVFDGEAWRFLTDVVAIAPLDEWRPPGVAPHRDPEEYVRIAGDALRPTADGRLRLAITEELRELTYLDRVRLVRVVHPAGIEVRNDESTRQGGVEPLEVFVWRAGDVVAPPAVESDRRGAAEPGVLARADRRWFRPFVESRSQWAGWVEPHSMTIELPDAWRQREPSSPALLLTGRIAWQDSGVAYALWQHGRIWMAPRLDAIDAAGESRTLYDDVGFPAGMDRTLVVPLDLPERATSVRIEATSRLLHDRVAFVGETARAVLPDAGTASAELAGERVELRSETLTRRRAELAWRGFSAIVGDVERHEHVYDFSRPTVWRDFPMPRGHATEYGDVGELVTEVDDRLVVLPPGDVLWLDFDAGEPPGPGESVTYFLRLTGWAKESGFHNSTGRQVGPLPWASMPSYPEGARETPAALGSDVERSRATRRIGDAGL